MIRPARHADVEALEQLEKACFTDCWSARLLAAGIDSPYDLVLMLEEDDVPVGYAVLRILAGEAEIQRIAVLPSLRRRGYARKLMDHMVRNSKEKQADSIILEVRFSNHAARSLYKAYGFREEGIRGGYYQHPDDDAVLLRLPLL